jgi:hypothetical protein
MDKTGKLFCASLWSVFVPFCGLSVEVSLRFFLIPLNTINVVMIR